MSFANTPPNKLQRFLQFLPASRVGAWLFAPTLHHIDRFLLRLSNGRVSIPGVLNGLPVIRLTTIGAKSGLPRTVPVVGLPDGDKIVLIASNFGHAQNPAWYYNLRAHPEATVVLPTRTGTYIAREATAKERTRYWRRAADLYLGYPAYQQRTQGRVIPIMVLTPRTK